MPQSKTTPYYLELEEAHRETQALRDQARAYKARRVRALLRDGVPMREVARMVGIHHETVKKIRDGHPKWTFPE